MWKDAEEFLSSDEYLGPLVKKYSPCKIRKRDKKHYFEDLIDAIIQQQLSMKAAASIFGKVKNKFLDVSGEHDFNKHKWRSEKTSDIEITAEKILKLSDNELRGCGLSRAKVSYVKDLSYRVTRNNLDLSSLGKYSDDEIAKKLTEVKGIGEWTAHMFMMFTLARPDVFPVGDLGLRNAFKKVTGRNLDNIKMEKFALRWKPYRTVASWYLWKVLEI